MSMPLKKNEPLAVSRVKGGLPKPTGRAHGPLSVNPRRHHRLWLLSPWSYVISLGGRLLAMEDTVNSSVTVSVYATERRAAV